MMALSTPLPAAVPGNPSAGGCCERLAEIEVEGIILEKQQGGYQQIKKTRHLFMGQTYNLFGEILKPLRRRGQMKRKKRIPTQCIASW